MKTWLVMPIAAVLAIAFGQASFGQPQLANNQANGKQAGGRGMGQRNGQMMPPGQMRAQMKFSNGSLYVLQGNTLTKYAAATLEELGKVQIEEKVTEVRAQGQVDKANGNQPQRPFGQGTAAFLVADGQVLLVANNTVYRIDAETMTTTNQVALPVADQGADQNGMPQRWGGAPQLELGGNILFVQQGNQLYSVDIVKAKVLGQAEMELPAGPPPGAGPDDMGGPPPDEPQQ